MLPLLMSMFIIPLVLLFLLVEVVDRKLKSPILFDDDDCNCGLSDGAIIVDAAGGVYVVPFIVLLSLLLPITDDKAPKIPLLLPLLPLLVLVLILISSPKMDDDEEDDEGCVGDNDGALIEGTGGGAISDGDVEGITGGGFDGGGGT